MLQLPPLLGGEEGAYHLLELPPHPKSYCAPVAHSNNWLDNTPIIGSLLFPVSLTHSSSGVSWDQLSNKTTYA